jgi:hypothetical protein
LAQKAKNFREMLDMCFKGWAVDQDIIHKHEDRSTQTGFPYHVHHTLKGGWSVAEAERHDFKLVVSLMDFEGRLGFILSSHAYLMIPST